MMIKEYHNKVKDRNITFTDDASICEYFNEPVRWFETDSLNIKITTKEDLKLFEGYVLLQKKNIRAQV